MAEPPQPPASLGRVILTVESGWGEKLFIWGVIAIPVTMLVPLLLTLVAGNDLVFGVGVILVGALMAYWGWRSTGRRVEIFENGLRLITRREERTALWKDVTAFQIHSIDQNPTDHKITIRKFRLELDGGPPLKFRRFAKGTSDLWHQLETRTAKVLITKATIDLVIGLPFHFGKALTLFPDRVRYRKSEIQREDVTFQRNPYDMFGLVIAHRDGKPTWRIQTRDLPNGHILYAVLVNWKSMPADSQATSPH